MTYNGNYNNTIIYGTALNNKLKVTTSDNATFISVDVTVTFNNLTWTHNFKVPFYQNDAELYIENYIHSIITQHFNITTFSNTQLQLHPFNLADINVVIKEMIADTELDSLTLNFKMLLGEFNQGISYADIATTKIALNTPLPITHSANSVLSFSFLAGSLPTTLQVNNSDTTTAYTLPTLTSVPPLYTITIPLQALQVADGQALTLSVKFTDDTTLQLGDVLINNDVVDHNLIGFQNQLGTLSVLECTGQLKTDVNYKTDTFQQNSNTLSTVDVTYGSSFNIDTGYILDANKYQLLYQLLQSYQILLLTNGITPILLNGSQKLQPYKSNYYLNNETLKFKHQSNDHIHYRVI